MAQQLNLYDPRLRPQRVPFGATHGALLVLGTLALCAALAWGQRTLGERSAAQADRLAAEAAALQLTIVPAAPASSGEAMARASAELAQLRDFDAGQRRVRDALAGQDGQRPEGYAGYFLALARQAQPSVWITGLTVSEDGHELTLEGRMTDANRLADYLRRLDAEPRFRGRAFEQLRLASVDAAAGSAQGGYTEFVLRSRHPATGTATPTPAALAAAALSTRPEAPR